MINKFKEILPEVFGNTLASHTRLVNDATKGTVHEFHKPNVEIATIQRPETRYNMENRIK